MKKYFFSTLIIVFTFLVLPICVFAVTNSGFIPGQIWYSKDILVEGDTVNIHTAVWNAEKDSISVKVEFYDKSVILGSREITLTSSELKDVFITWKVTSGDHVISAKITSSQKTVSGKKENIVLSKNTTDNNKQFVSVVVKNSNGEPISATNKIQDQLESTGEKINNMLPKSVSNSVSSGFDIIEDFRNNTSTKLNTIKEETKKELDLIIVDSSKETVTQDMAQKKSIEEATKKPINYIKLFLFTVLALIFSTKILFYGLLVFITFLILRKIYRLIRNR